MATCKHKSSISEILSRSGCSLLTINDNESEFCDFYLKLFTKKSDQRFISMNVNWSPISAAQSAALEHPFTEEVHRAVSSSGVSKFPGLDGFTTEFYKFF